MSRFPLSSGFVTGLTSALHRVRLACLTLAWVAALISIVMAQPSGSVAATGAIAFGMFILLTITGLRRDSLVILAVDTMLLVESMPGPAASCAASRLCRGGDPRHGDVF